MVSAISFMKSGTLLPGSGPFLTSTRLQGISKRESSRPATVCRREFRKRKPAALGPVHGTTHSQIAIHAPDGVGGVPWVKFDGIESVAGDVLPRSADPDLIPMPVCFVFSSSLQQLLHLIRWRVTTGKGVAACDRQSHRAWMQFQNASHIVMKVITSWTTLFPTAHPICD